MANVIKTVLYLRQELGHCTALLRCVKQIVCCIVKTATTMTSETFKTKLQKTVV